MDAVNAKPFNPSAAPFQPPKPSKYEDDAILSIKEVSKPAAKKEGFFGDSESGMKKTITGKERTLTKTEWLAGSQVQGTSSLHELEQADEDKSSFDQFANRRTTYKESLYNTTYDINKLSRSQIEEAERIDREISSKDAGGNVHLAEERGQVVLKEDNSEET